MEFFVVTFFLFSGRIAKSEYIYIYAARRIAKSMCFVIVVTFFLFSGLRVVSTISCGFPATPALVHVNIGSFHKDMGSFHVNMGI